MEQPAQLTGRKVAGESQHGPGMQEHLVKCGAIEVAIQATDPSSGTPTHSPQPIGARSETALHASTNHSSAARPLAEAIPEGINREFLYVGHIDHWSRPCRASDNTRLYKPSQPGSLHHVTTCSDII